MSKKWYSSRSFYGAFVFAIALWGYTSLNDVYNTNLSVPLEITLPNDRALKNDIPNSIGVQFRGTGWDLFNINFFGSSLTSSIDLKSRDLQGNSMMITKTEMLNSLKNLGNLEARNINSDQFEIYYGKILNKKLPIIPNISIKLKEGFKQITDLRLDPDSVILRGNEDILDTINYWKTKDINFNNIAQDINIQIDLSDTLKQIVEKNINKTRVFCKISQLGNIYVPDREYTVNGGRLPDNYSISPKTIDITIQAPLEYLDSFDPNNIELFIDYKEAISSKQGVVPIHYNIDTTFKVRKIEPKFIYISKEISKN